MYDGCKCTEAMKKVCIARNTAFDQAGNASKMRAVGLI
jgi:hypothetical protein